MALKYYGIYIAYAPNVDLRHEGLGRYMAAFLKAASEREDTRFVILCPSWSRGGLTALFLSEGVPSNRFEIYSPQDQPLLLRLYGYLQPKLGKGRWLSFRLRFVRWIQRCSDICLNELQNYAVRTYSLFSLPLLVLMGILLVIPGLLLSILFALLGGIYLMFCWVLRSGDPIRKVVRRFLTRLASVAENPKEDGLVFQLYKKMETAEILRMQNLAAGLKHVGAWYCPTAFWPEFNRINAPRLICVPDVVLTDFPVAFSDVGGDRFLSNFQAIESAIRSGQNFVTYSEVVKWDTLVSRYSVRASQVAVVHHAPNDLSGWVQAGDAGDPHAVAVSKNYCEELFLKALQRSTNPSYLAGFQNSSVKFLFYASQFRPNKNLLSLLRAYTHLLRKRWVGHKLVLTGHPKVWAPIDEFIHTHGLQNDVLCLHGLSINELAACYKLADLAVNPSLSEGGCPFTFTEALSVDTPVVMARIPVTEEVLVDPELQAMTFFDPYDWQDMAQRIEWALLNREALLTVQRKTYATLRRRSWTDVVNEHINVLDQISGPAVAQHVDLTVLQ